MGCLDIDRRLRSLLGGERRTQVAFLRALDEFERCEGYGEFGYTSTWEYCRRELKLEKGQIFRRLHASRMLGRFSQIAEYLLDGRLSMTTLVVLREVMSPENADELLEKAAGKSKEDVELIAVTLRPREVSKKEIFRAMPSREQAALVPVVSLADGTASNPGSVSPGSATTGDAEPPPASGAVAAPAPPVAARQNAPVLRAVGPREYVLKLVVPVEFKEKIDRVRMILSNKLRTGGVEDVLTAALDVVIARDERKLRGPSRKKKAPTSEAVPPAEPNAEGTREAVSLGEPATIESAGVSLGEPATLGSAGVPRGEPATIESAGVPLGEPATIESAGVPRGEPATIGSAGVPLGELRFAGEAVNVLPGDPNGSVPSAERDAPGAYARGGESASREGKKRQQRVCKRRHVSAATRRAVRKRDGDQCTFMLANGERCGCQWKLQIDHIIPVARGGTNDLSNLRLVCRAHNIKAARKIFGDAVMDRYVTRRKAAA